MNSILIWENKINLLKNLKLSKLIISGKRYIFFFFLQGEVSVLLYLNKSFYNLSVWYNYVYFLTNIFAFINKKLYVL